MKRRITLFLCLLLAVSAQSQMITTEPAFPVYNKPLTIYFHSDLATGALKDYTLPLYVHTGVNLSDGRTWQYVIGSWGNNSTQPMLEYTGSFTYKLTMPAGIQAFYSVSPSLTITQISMVIRSADGTRQTSPDIFIPVYQEGFNAGFTLPDRRIGVYDINREIPVSASANLADSMALYKNDVYVAGNDGSLSLDYTLLADVAGENQLVVKAFSGPESISDTFFYHVMSEGNIQSLPDGIADGINYLSDTSVILCLYAPFKENAFVVGDFSGWLATGSTRMNKTPDGNRYWKQINSLYPGKEYGYQYLVDGSILIADPYTDKVLDQWNDIFISSTTYPDLKAYPAGLTSGIVSVFQTAREPFKWNHDDFTAPPKENLVIYELLVRDFTGNHDWKTLTDTLDYFSKLGVNALEIMPFNEFVGNSTWGYNPSYYFAPDKYYGPGDDLKAFVDSCHSRGIAVIMDIVLNHSDEASIQGPLLQLYWNEKTGQPAANNPWYNQVSPNPVYVWGYDFNHESQDTRNFVDRVTSYWLTEYKLDGYRFDFTKGFTNTPGDGGNYDPSRIAILKRIADKIWEVNPDAYVILEHLTPNEEEKELSDYGIMLWGNINYSYNQATMGWNDYSDFSWISYKLRNWNYPGLVGYMESHDEERLMVRNRLNGNSSGDYSTKQLNTALERMEQAAAFFFTVPGPKMIWQFGEMGYDVSIDFNSRLGPKPLHWEYLVKRARLHKVYTSLIHLKIEEPAFSTTDFTCYFSSLVKRLELNHEDMDVRIIGNFDVVSRQINPNFSLTGSWYDYFSGETIDVTNVNSLISLEPGEYHIYTTRKLETPQLPLEIRNKNIQADQLLVYPNPVENLLQVEGNSIIEKLRITDLNGKAIRTLQPGTRNITIDFSGIDRGIYILEAQQGKSGTVQRIVKW